MKIWLLKARRDLPENDDPWSPWYDKVFGFVIRAETEKEARLLASTEAADEKHNDLNPWLLPQYSSCANIGITWEPTENILLIDYHAA